MICLTQCVKSGPRRPGRPPAGPGGEKVTYPQLTIRFPAETKAKLSTLSLLTAMPIWRLIDRAVEAYVQHLPHWETMWQTHGKGHKPKKGPAPKRNKGHDPFRDHGP
jgi:hypothetical protein